MVLTDAFVGVVAIVFTAFYVKKQSAEVETVVSTYDQKPYLVRSLPNKRQAANLLAQMSKRLEILVKHMNSLEHKNRDDIDRLVRNFDPRSISEGSEKTSYTSYSINKGEKIVFCLRSKTENEKLIDINTLMYVAIHELGHLMTKEIGHPPAFWKNFVILLKEAIKIGVWKRVDYAASPVQYCGMTIKGTILDQMK